VLAQNCLGLADLFSPPALSTCSHTFCSHIPIQISSDKQLKSRVQHAKFEIVAQFNPLQNR
jgi:hypothetical protein